MTVVLVAHDGEKWLPRTLDGLARQTGQPSDVVAVDTGSEDGTYQLLADALGNSRVIRAERHTTFGQAIALAARTFDATPHDEDSEHATEWLWLLHDDSAPAPDALQRLLERAETAREAVVIGPKIRDWDHPAYLLEVGLTMDGAGHRHTGLERHELDQGQHDSGVDVLAVGSAGVLIRRDAWDALGGFDPRLPMFRDDIDFGWRANLSGRRVVVAPRAVVFHAQAGATGRRPLAVTDVPPRRLDRTHAMFTVLANASVIGVLVGVPRLGVVSVLRALLFLATRRPVAAGDELLAYGALLLRLPTLVRARRWRRRTRAVARREVRHLLPRRGSRLRSYIEHVAEWLGGHTLLDTPGAALGRPDVIASDDDSPDVPINSVSARVLKRIVTAPGVLLVVGLTVVSLVAWRDLLGLHGTYVGGRLLPMPDGASDLWRAFVADWHSVGVGVRGASPPSAALLAALSTITLGKPWLAVTVLLVGAIPLAGATAYRTARRVTDSRPLQLWAAAAYALAPPLTGAVAAGRVDAVAGLVLLPVAAGSLARCLRTGSEHRRAWVAAFAVTLAVAATPILYAVLLVALAALLLAAAGGSVLGRRARHSAAPAASVRWRAVGRGVIVAAVPLVVLAPWSLSVLRHPSLAVRGLGPVTADSALAAPRVLDLLLGLPGGPGMPPAWLYVPILLAGVAAVSVDGRRRFVFLAWGAALATLVVGVALTRVVFVAADLGGPWRVWAGLPAALVVGLLLASAASAAQGTRGRFRRASFSWRQPVSAVIALAAGLVPVVAAAWLVTNAAPEVARVPPPALPAYVADAIGGDAGTRALLLRPSADAVDYAVLEGPVRTMDDTFVPLPGSRQAQLTQLVRQLTSGPSAAAGLLPGFGIGYLVLLQPDSRIAAALDAQPGVRRVPQAAAIAVWTVNPPPPRIGVVSASDAGLLQRPVPPQPGQVAITPLRAAYGAQQTLPNGPAGRLLVLAETADSGWRATLDGRRLPPATPVYGTQQAFVLPSGGGRLVVRYEWPRDDVLRWVALAALLVVVVLAAPPVRLREDVPGEPDDEFVEPDRRPLPVGGAL